MDVNSVFSFTFSGVYRVLEARDFLVVIVFFVLLSVVFIESWFIWDNRGLLLNDRFVSRAEVQRQAVDKIKFDLKFRDESCYVDWEKGFAFAKINLKTQKMVRCDLDRFSKSKRELIKLFKKVSLH